MAKGKLPEGYKGVDKLIEEFRKDNPKGKIQTSAQDLGDGFVIISATITKDDGAMGSGMADADVQTDKAVEKAESGAIRRALLTLGYKSLEGEGSDNDDSSDEKEEKQESRRFGGREEKKEDRRSESARDADEADRRGGSLEEEKPRSRFGGKSSDKSRDRGTNQDEEQEGESKFKRGSRFQRN